MRISVNSLRTRRVPEPAMNHTPLRGGAYSHVSERANDIDIEGYVDAQFKLLKSLESNFSQVNSVPIAFEVSYQDVFHRKIVFPVVQYLRFANISSSNYVFYPSKLKYEKLECIHL